MLWHITLTRLSYDNNSKTATMASVIAKKPQNIENLTNTILPILPHDRWCTTFFVRAGNWSNWRKALSKPQRSDRHPSTPGEQNCGEISSPYNFTRFTLIGCCKHTDPPNKSIPMKTPALLAISHKQERIEYKKEGISPPSNPLFCLQRSP